MFKNCLNKNLIFKNVIIFAERFACSRSAENSWKLRSTKANAQNKKKVNQMSIVLQ